MQNWSETNAIAAVVRNIDPSLKDQGEAFIEEIKKGSSGSKKKKEGVSLVRHFSDVVKDLHSHTFHSSK